MSATALLVDDDADMGETLATALATRGFETQTCTSAEEALRCSRERDFDVVITDDKMPGMTGIELCEQLVENRPDLQVVVITAFGSMERAIAAIRAGAYDFLTKPFELEQLIHVVNRAARVRELDREIKRLRQVASPEPSHPELVGDSPAMRDLRAMLERIGDSPASVLITGESGTGKELVARALHRQSGRKGEFVAINCAAMPENLLESELFGHAKGAFTDARTAREGLFRKADGGTLFLDEIGEMPMALQVKLLRALQERHVRPVGGDSEQTFDARVIAATNRDLESQIETGAFREDLFFRLNVIAVLVPPLRARGNDVLLLAQKFLERISRSVNKEITGFAPPAAQRLLDYSWPGNVRELENCIERAVTLAQYDHIVLDDLPDRVRSYRASHVIAASDDPADLLSMEEVEKRYIRRVLEVVGGNKTQAAKILGFGRKTLYRRLERYRIDVE